MERPAEQTVADLLSNLAAQQAARTAIVCPDEHAELTYADLGARAHAAAAAFKGAGLGSHTKLAVMLPNGVRYVTCLFGAWRLGAVVVPIDPMLKGPDARDILKASRAKALAIDAKRFVEVTGLLEECESLDVTLVSGDVPAGARIRDLDATLAQAAEAAATQEISGPLPSDTAIEAYRFHTDNLEAVPRTHEALSNDAALLASRLTLMPEDRGICAVPLSHINGVTALVASIGASSRMVITERFDPRRFWELVAAQRATWLALVPTQFLDLHFGGAPPSGAHKSIRVVAVAGAAVTATMCDEFADRFGLTVLRV